MKLNKLILIPLLAAIADFVKNLTGYEIGNDNIELAANIILGAVTIVGVWMNRHKKPTTQTEVMTDAKHKDLSDAF